MTLRPLFVLAACAAPAGATDPGLFVQPTAPPAFVGSCVSCGTRELSSLGGHYGPRAGGPVQNALYPFTIGEGCRMPVGPSSYFSERTFFWGSARQFYTPGNKCGAWPGSACSRDIPGAGPLQRPEPSCAYGSFHNK